MTTDPGTRPCTAFAGTRRIASGPLCEVALAAQAAETRGETGLLVFDDATGRVVDLDLRGSAEEIRARLAAGAAPETAPETPEASAAGEARRRARGRPRIGVVAREVTLLPRHWDWLSAQPGGASQALRRLVDAARRSDDGRTARRQAQERAYRFMAALLGDQPDFEEAARALFADDAEGLARRTANWPAEARNHALALARPDTAE